MVMPDRMCLVACIAKETDRPSIEGADRFKVSSFVYPTPLVVGSNSLSCFIFILFALKCIFEHKFCDSCFVTCYQSCRVFLGHCKQGAVRADSWARSEHLESTAHAQTGPKRGLGISSGNTKIDQREREDRRQRTVGALELSFLGL